MSTNEHNCAILANFIKYLYFFSKFEAEHLRSPCRIAPTEGTVYDVPGYNGIKTQTKKQKK